MELLLREVQPEDMDLLFGWANDPVVRENSFNSDPIKYEDHKKWFNKMINDRDIIQYILMSEEKPVGQVRLTIHGEEAEIGYSIATEFRGRGFAKKMLDMMKDALKKDRSDIKRIIAKVKPDNGASRKVFESLGYEEEYTCYIYKS